MIIYCSPKLNAPRRGQAMLEMAVVMIVLLFLTMGLIQFALLANARITLTNLARDGARYAAVHALDATADDLIRNHIVEVADSTPLNSVAAGDIVITPPMNTTLNNTSRVPGQLITVVVSYDMHNKFILPVRFPGLAGFGTTGTSTTSTAMMTIE